MFFYTFLIPSFVFRYNGVVLSYYSNKGDDSGISGISPSESQHFQEHNATNGKAESMVTQNHIIPSVSGSSVPGSSIQGPVTVRIKAEPDLDFEEKIAAHSIIGKKTKTFYFYLWNYVPVFNRLFSPWI